MKRSFEVMPLIAIAVLALPALADAPAAADLPAAPDVIAPEDIIAAREALMVQAEELMKPIDTYTVDDAIDPDLMRTNANAVAAMLQALPNLFPERTNLYDAGADSPATLALPGIWENFASFYGLAEAASAAATKLAETYDADELRAASLGLRASCDACHSLYLLPYEEPTVTQEERDFDFDSIFEDQ